MTVRGLLVDFGGVLTTDVFASFDTFCANEGLPAGTVKALFRTDPRARELLSGLEDGTLADADFERRFAELLGVAPDDLIERLLGHAGLDTAMLDAVRAARGHGIRTGLVSNSWGVDRYDRALLTELFDGVVISAEVGFRKPTPEIYALGMGVALNEIGPAWLRAMRRSLCLSWKRMSPALSAMLPSFADRLYVTKLPG